MTHEVQQESVTTVRFSNESPPRLPAHSEDPPIPHLASSTAIRVLTPTLQKAQGNPSPLKQSVHPHKRDGWERPVPTRATSPQRLPQLEQLCRAVTSLCAAPGTQGRRPWGTPKGTITESLVISTVLVQNPKLILMIVSNKQRLGVKTGFQHIPARVHVGGSSASRKSAMWGGGHRA